MNENRHSTIFIFTTWGPAGIHRWPRPVSYTVIHFNCRRRSLSTLTSVAGSRCRHCACAYSTAAKQSNSPTLLHIIRPTEWGERGLSDIKSLINFGGWLHVSISLLNSLVEYRPIRCKYKHLIVDCLIYGIYTSLRRLSFLGRTLA